MRVAMHYGRGELELRLPDERFAGHESFADRTASLEPPAGTLERALGELAEAGFDAATEGAVLGLLVADGTRERTYEGFLAGLAGVLRGAREVRVFVATGTHDPASPENLELAADLSLELERLSIPAELHVHDARAEDLVPVGTTSRGTRVEVHPRLADCEVFLVLANMKYHYFAGYSNPVKYYVPGLSAHETARGNHSLTLEPDSTFGRHPWHPEPDRRRNPLAEDMVEAFREIVGRRPHFALAVVGSVKHPAWSGGGRTEEVAGRAMAVVDRVAGLEVRPSRFLVVSPGGHPHDESLYTAQRALELTRAAVQGGGEVLFLAACANGVGTPAARRAFFDPLTRPLEEVCRRPEGPYVLYSHKSYKFGQYLSGLARVHMHTELPPEEVASIHLVPAPDAQAVLDEWLRCAGPGDAVSFIDDASKFAAHRAADGAQVPMP